MSDEVSWFARQYIDYVYVPGLLLVVGTAIVKREWVIYAIPLAIVLGAWNVWSFREFFFFDLPKLALLERQHTIRFSLPVVANCS